MDESQNDGAAAGLSRGRRMLVLGICCLSLLIVGLDSTIVNVALPAIRSSLNASISGLQWTIDAYTLVLASLLMLAGSTADRIGRRRVFRTGLVVFSLGSLLCGLAPTLELLIAARVLQAIGGSMLNPVALSIIRNVFDDARERALAIGAWGGGVRPEHGARSGARWRAGRLGRLARGVLRQRSHRGRSHRADHPVRPPLAGGAAAAPGPDRAGPGDPRAGLAHLLDHRGSAGRLDLGRDARTVRLLTGLLCPLVFYELHHREPLLEMRFFRSVPFAGASTIAVCAFAAQGGFLFLNTLYLQGVAAFRRSTRACTCCRWPGWCSCSRRCRGAW